jgi:hypothetical protein
MEMMRDVIEQDDVTMKSVHELLEDIKTLQTLSKVC